MLLVGALYRPRPGGGTAHSQYGWRSIEVPIACLNVEPLLNASHSGLRHGKNLRLRENT